VRWRGGKREKKLLIIYIFELFGKQIDREGERERDKK
jgi:hypothetical protein